MASLAGPLLGGVSLVSGLLSNRDAANRAAAAQATANSLANAQLDGYNQYKSIVNNAYNDGQFDPEKQISQLESDNARTQQVQTGNLNAGLKLLGYKPGDSEVSRQNENVAAQQQQWLDQQRLSLRQQSLSSLIGAYQGLNSGSSSLNAGMQNALTQQQIANSQTQSPSSLLSSIMPYMAKTATATPTVPTMTGGLVNYNTNPLTGGQQLGSGTLGGYTYLGGRLG